MGRSRIIAGDDQEGYEGDDDERGVDVEDDVRAPGIAEDARGGRADEGGDCYQRPCDAHRVSPPVGGRPVADDGERARRENGRADAVYGPSRHHLLRRLDEGVAEHGDRRDRHAQKHGRSPAPPVEDISRSQVAEQVGERVCRNDQAYKRRRRSESLGYKGTDGRELDE